MGLVIAGCILMFAALIFQKGWTAPVAVVFVTFVGLVTLYGYFLEIRGLLKCPRCGFSLPTSGTHFKGGKEGFVICRHCAPRCCEAM